MRQLLPADVHCYHEFAPGHFRAVDTPEILTQPLVEAFVAHIDEHPSIQFIQQTGCRQPLMFSDFVSLREFRQTGLYWEFFRKVDIERQVAGIINAGDMDIGYAFNRRRTPYREEDRLLLDLLATHFPKARRNAKLWSKLQSATKTESGPPVLGVDTQGRIRMGTAAAARLLQAYFPDTPADRLPEPLIRWMAEQRARIRAKDRVPEAADSFSVSSVRGRLTVRYSPPDVGHLEYLLLEESVVTAPDALNVLGLTKRETEVLHWLAEGKRNAEIAVILGMTTRTVGKHLEHIFAKLGVETRAAAAAIARDCRHGNR